MHDEHIENLFLQTRGLPKPATGEQAQSRPFGTTIVVNGDMAEIKLNSGK